MSVKPFTPYAKLFDTKLGQLLVRLVELEDTEDFFGVEFSSTPVGLGECSIKLGFSDEQKQMDCFDNLDQEKAERTAQRLYDSVKQFI